MNPDTTVVIYHCGHTEEFFNDDLDSGDIEDLKQLLCPACFLKKFNKA